MSAKDFWLSILYSIVLFLLIGGVLLAKIFWYCRTAAISFHWWYPVIPTTAIWGVIMWRCWKK